MKKIYLVLLVNLLFNIVDAQNIVFEQVLPLPPASQTVNDFIGVSHSSNAVSDVDNDGDLDILITGGNELGNFSVIYLNDGLGNYEEWTNDNLDGVEVGSVSFGDVDNDGNEDLFISGKNNMQERISKLFVNDGNGNYSEQTSSSFIGVSYGSSAFADVDNDNDLDLLIIGFAASQKISKLYLNDGVGNFTEQTNSSFIEVSNGSVAFADIDNDNDQDLFITGYTTNQVAIKKLYLNDGGGNFSEKPNVPFDDVYLSSAAFSDVDGDNDLDLFISGRNNSNGRISKLYLNDGGGNFSEQTSSPFVGVSSGSSAFADIDNDSDLDLLITGETADSSPMAQLYINNGNGEFIAQNDNPFIGVVLGSSVLFLDVDSDNDLDALISGYSYGNTTSLYINDGNGVFEKNSGSSFFGVHLGSVVFTDIDNDNDQDLFIAGLNSNNSVSKLYLNDGFGNYSEKENTPFIGVSYSSAAFLDVDNDNDQDLVITGRDNSNERIAKLYLNDGSGNYVEETNTPFIGVFQGSLSFADIDNDNDQDLFIAGLNSNNSVSKLYLNDGLGNYSEQTNSSLLGVFGSSSAFADIDDDNDQDLLITGFDGTQTVSKLYINDGIGNFTEYTTNIPEVFSGSLAFADVNNDSYQDLVITGFASTESISKLYFGDGNGSFVEQNPSPFAGVYSSSIAIEDVDNDGDKDLFITGEGHSYERISKLYINDGLGNYTEVTDLPFILLKNSSIAFADIDNDNDFDLLISGNSSSGPVARLYRNVSSLANNLLESNHINTNLTLYPNPANKIVNIKSAEVFAAQCQILDLAGHVLKEVSVEEGVKEISLDISNLPKGLYFVKIGEQVEKLIVE